MLNNEISHKYDDILSLPHPNSTNHPRMARGDRAAQFSSFAALTGHEEAISETARLTDEKQHSVKMRWSGLIGFLRR